MAGRRDVAMSATRASALARDFPAKRKEMRFSLRAGSRAKQELTRLILTTRQGAVKEISDKSQENYNVQIW